MKASKRQKLVAYLLDRGCTEVQSRSKKYVGWNCPVQENGTRIWLGSAGAIRKGITPTNSRPAANWAVQRLHSLAEKFWSTLTIAEQKHIIESYPQPAKRRNLR